MEKASGGILLYEMQVFQSAHISLWLEFKHKSKENYCVNTSMQLLSSLHVLKFISRINNNLTKC